MAQIIKHRRGSLESLSSVTGSLQKGEIVIASGSSNLSVTNGASIVFAVPENGQVQAVNRILVGANAPNTFAAGTYNGMLKGVPYYASGSSTLYLLGEGANEIPDLTGNINNFSSSVATNFSSSNASITSLSASVASVTGDFSSSVATSFSASAASQTTLSASVATSISASNASVTSLSASVASVTGDFSSSVATSFSASNASITSLSASVASVTGDFSSSVATSFSASAASQTVLSQSVSASFASVAVEQSTQDDRLDAIEAVGLTYATTGSNIFFGSQTITGSLYITQNLVVQGSSSLQHITASALDIGANIIELNTAAPAVRFGGVSVQDSGSFAGVSGSLLWDSFNNHWLYVQPSSSGEEYNSAILIAGPKNTGTIGDEATITSGSIQVALGENHIGDSIITQVSDNSKVNIDGGLGVSGSIVVDNAIIGTGSIFLQPDITDSRKLEIYNTAATDVHIKATGGLTFLGDDTNYVEINDSLQTIRIVGVNGVSIETGLNVTGSISSSLGFSGSIAGIGNVTEYSQSVSASLAAIVANVGSGVGVSIDNLNSFTSSINTTIDTQLDSKSVISSSAQVDLTSANNTGFDTSYVSENASYLYYTDGRVKDKLDSESVISSSAQVGLTSADNTGFDTSYVSENASYLYYTDGRVKDKLDSESVISSSAQVDITSTTGYTTFSGSISSSFSASNANITSLSASVASVTGDFSSSVATSFSASAASQTTLSSSLAGRITTLEGTGTIQGVGESDEVTFAKVTTTGDVVVGGDLVVQGNTVTLNTATLVVEDKLITLASGSTSSATADGAGFEVAGADANFVYQHSTTAFTSSVALIAPAVTSSINLGSTAGSSKRIAFRNTNGNLDLVPTASVAGDLLQWDGTDFVMSNTIDGGSF